MSKKFAFIQPLYLATKWFIRLKNEKQKKTKKKNDYTSRFYSTLQLENMQIKLSNRQHKLKYKKRPKNPDAMGDQMK